MHYDYAQITSNLIKKSIIHHQLVTGVMATTKYRYLTTKTWSIS